MSDREKYIEENAADLKPVRCGDVQDKWSEMSYVLITPAKNEASFIRGALESIIAQTVCPSRWIIVDDGSTDETAAIVERYAFCCRFISLLRLPPGGEREFANKATAFNAGLQLIRECDYSFVGNLDADISVEPTYYETVLCAFKNDPLLGISGGKVCTTVNAEFVCRDRTIDSVGGAVQLFRRKCFEEIGGYRGLPFGGIDAAAEIIARSKGWHVRKMAQSVYEHRQTGSAHNNIWKARYRDGIKFHTLGYGSIFFACRCIFRLTDIPICIGSVLSMAGFVSARARRLPICMPRDAVEYLRSEQKNKLWQWLYRIVDKLHTRNMGGGKIKDELPRSSPRSAARR